jgi:hypothetical protein
MANPDLIAKQTPVKKVAMPSKPKAAFTPKDPNLLLKRGIWVFFILWVFEGALRKWVLPQLSMPLLVIRDPVALWLLFQAFKRGLLKSNVYLNGMVIMGVVSLMAAIFMGHRNTWVAIYGARTMALYFPLIFVIGRVFNQEDVLKMGRVVLMIAIPMTLLLALQFYSPQTAWVNRGVGGDEDGAGFGGALGYFRPPGTFSFTNGTTCFYSLVAPFVIYFWLNPKKIDRRILILATGALIIAIPTSISRGLFLQIAVSIFFMLIAISRNPKYFGKVFLATILVVAALALFSNVGFFATATEAFTARFEGANESEGGLVEGTIGNRFFGALIKAFAISGGSMMGVGVGSGTPLGALLLRDDTVSRTADFEWIREIGELGLMGLIVIALRVGLALKISVASNRKLKKGDMLPWLMMSVGILIVSQGQWHQPTALGFCALMGGLWMASLRSLPVKKPPLIKKKTMPGKQASLTIIPPTEAKG